MSTTTMAAPSGASTGTSTSTSLASGSLAMSNLSQQLDGEITPKSNKSRSLSDAPKPTLSPSPAIREPSRRVSKDDLAVTTPTTPRRSLFHARGLSLQMPPKGLEDGGDESPLGASIARTPLSPKLDPNPIYGSPASVLPRRSRGLDFARASTNLHHSTLAESSPDASPIAGRGIHIPSRRSLGMSSGAADSPSQISNPWTTERTNLSSSVSSINMMDSDSDSDSSSDMVMDDDPVLNTPAASRLNGMGVTASPGMEWLNGPGTPAQNSLLNFQPNFRSFKRARFNRNGKSNHSSSSVSMRSSKPSPGPLSPPIRPTVESSGYFGLMKEARSRRESLSLGTDDLHLSDSEWDAEHRSKNQPNPDSTPERGVIRRPVTRRSNLLPKTKGFARIRAALMEESDPLNSDARREAEVVKQVQESDAEYRPKSHSQPTDSLSEALDTIESGLDMIDSRPPTRQPSFSIHAERNSAGLGFWNTFDHMPPQPQIDRYRTPPPTHSNRDSISAMSDELTESITNTSHHSQQQQTQPQQPYDHPSSSLLQHLHRSRSRSTTPLASASNNNSSQPPSANEAAKRVNNKRRRDDDFDPASFKRRAVSPGMSAQSSPVVPQSPTLLSLSGDKSWGRPPAGPNGSGAASATTPGKPDKVERSNSGGSTVSRDGQGQGQTNNNTGTAPKRVGLQGMTEANEGFMSMSID